MTKAVDKFKLVKTTWGAGPRTEAWNALWKKILTDVLAKVDPHMQEERTDKNREV